MSVHFILDGYNIIRQIPQFNDRKLEKERENLILFLETQRPQGSANNPVTVVFDGQPGVGGARVASLINVIFSCGGSADDTIKDMVAQSEQRKATVVVTDDRQVRYYVRALGAKVLAVKEFFVKGANVPGRSGTGSEHAGSEHKGISKSLEYQINQEMKGIWLDKKTKRRDS